MLRDSRASCCNSTNIENVDPFPHLPAARLELDPSRPPLDTIENHPGRPNPTSDRDAVKREVERTPSKGSNLLRAPGAAVRTPEKPMTAVTLGKNRFGWVSRDESGTIASDEITVMVPRGVNSGLGGSFGFTTPRPFQTASKATSSVHSETNSLQSTPCRSVNKPPKPAFVGSRPSPNTGARASNFAAASRGAPMSSLPIMVVNSVEVPHFELKEDPSFWMDHNVQVVIRVRPLNSTERSLQGYNRCLKQESAHGISWVGQTESRFTFDHVACETINQETIFRVAGLPMIENCISGYNSCMFAYGQTGSGKTYTMLGEIDELEARPKPDRGMTPRIFEFLFARIKAEEESRRDEKLKYNCRCSFLEIYNEQITDLLDPSSTNLLVREDIQRGVYVENLSEFAVENVNDILKLLIQGAANRKVAATNMNRASSRSHSVFTCVIESQWEKDSLTNLRFARLNLVDLAGSERQKTSGAEGERLKEAANINKSLSTLGHVIMLLVDVAQGKQRHIPYRDSRLTFLLQDSLGGNSKTVIIANVSPSICCASETLSTLKFAQRAKLIRNNAIVNEDASGDVIALRHQIRLLKEELSMLKRQNVSRSLSFRTTIFQDTGGDRSGTPYSERLPIETIEECANLQVMGDLSGMLVSTSQLKSLEATLSGALRREKMADTDVKNLEAEIAQLNCLVCQREEDTRCIKMMLKFREEKIQRLETIVNDLIPAESYLQEENKSLQEEIQLLRARADRNPELTRFALDNIRLRDQLRRFQDYYEDGERELLLAEVSQLRNQLVAFLDAKSEFTKGYNPPLSTQLEKTSQELKDCRSQLKSCLEVNEKLLREASDLRAELDGLKAVYNNGQIDCELQDMELCSGSSPPNSRQLEKLADVGYGYNLNHSEEILNLQLELDILKTIISEERSFRYAAEGKLMQINLKYDHITCELQGARSLIESLETERSETAQEMEELRESCKINLDILKQKESDISSLKKLLGIHFIDDGRESLLFQNLRKHERVLGDNGSPVQMKLKGVQASLDKAYMLNMRFQDDLVAQTSHEKEMYEVCQHVEAETSEVIVNLQEEISILQKAVEDSNKKELAARERLSSLEYEITTTNKRLCLVAEDNERLVELLREKDAELRSLCEEREELACEIAEALAGGDAVLDYAINQADLMIDSFSQRSWIGEQVNRIIRNFIQRNSLIEELQKSLEDAEKVMFDMEWKLMSLRGAMLAITETQQQKNTELENEFLLLHSQLSEKLSAICDLEHSLRDSEDKKRRADLRATVAFVVVNKLSELNSVYLEELERKEIDLRELESLNIQKDIILHEQILLYSSAEENLHLLSTRMEESDKIVAELKIKLAEEHNRFIARENQLREEEDLTASEYEDAITKTEERLNQLNIGISAFYSCLDAYSEEGGEQGNDQPGKHVEESPNFDSKHAVNTMSAQYVTDVNIIDDNVNDSNDLSTSNDGCFPREYKPNICSSIKKSRYSKALYDKEITILLLQKEIESSLRSLNGVQIQMNQLLLEKETVKDCEIHRRKDTEHLMHLVLKMNDEMKDKEKVVELKLLELNRKMQVLEDKVNDSITIWKKNKKDAVILFGEAQTFAAQKNFEALLFLSQLQNAQETMKEADIVVMALLTANESAKLEVMQHLEIESNLISERDLLVDEISVLRSSIDAMDKKYAALEAKSCLNLSELESVLSSLENTCMQLQALFVEELKLVSGDINCFKSLLFDSMGLAKKWLEDIWSEIIGKDCAVSVLHLCHLGILLEAITGLNTENRLFLYGLNDSSKTIAGLREQNIQSRKEFEMCSVLKGKLLMDICNGFNRLTNNEKETGKLETKIHSLDKKIMELQLQEEYMLERSNAMGFELSVLIKEFDVNDKKVSLDLFSKDLDILFLSSEMRERLECLNEKMLLLDDLEIQKHQSCRLIEQLKKELILSKIDGALENQLLMDMETNIAILTDETTEARLQLKFVAKDSCNLRLQLKQSKDKVNELESTLKKMEENCLENSHKELDLRAEITKQVNRLITKNNDLRKSEQFAELIACELKARNEEIERLHYRMQVMTSDHHSQLSEGAEKTAKLSRIFQDLQDENAGLFDNLFMKEVIIECTNCVLEASCEDHKKFQDVVNFLQTKISGYENILEMKNTELENVLCRNSNMAENLVWGRSEITFLRNELDALHDQNTQLKQDLNEALDSNSMVSEDLLSKSKEYDCQMSRTISLELENKYFRNQLLSRNQTWHHIFTALGISWKELSDSLSSFDISLSALAQIFYETSMSFMDSVLADFCKCTEKIDHFFEQFGALESYAKSLLSEILYLRSEQMRMEEMFQQNSQDAESQRNKLEIAEATIQFLKAKVILQSNQLDQSDGQFQMLESQLLEKCILASFLEFELGKQHESMKVVCGEKSEISWHLEETIKLKNTMELELERNANLVQIFENELQQMKNLLGEQKGIEIELKDRITKLSEERSQLTSDFDSMREHLEIAKAVAEANQAIATEAQQIAKSRKLYAEGKEEEVRLLEKSIKELECTIDVLQDKVEIVRGEAEKQRSQRVELEIELHKVNHHLLEADACNFQNTIGVEYVSGCDDGLECTKKDLRKKIQFLKQNLLDKDAEIAQYIKHISELNAHAEAQAQQNIEKIKELEAMVQQFQQSKVEALSANLTNIACNREKSATKSRGSGSPFKCIGLGLTHQINSEKEEELTAGRLQIQELEALVAKQQKEIFQLNARLAASESMTHDVIRDLLGVKLDITSYASFTDNHEVAKSAFAFQEDGDVEKEVQEIDKLKRQLNELIEERQGWLDEINRRQTEMVATKVSLEKLRQRDQFLTAENEILKGDNAKYKLTIMQLEDEIGKSCRQHNMQQRIHHHAKIKEDNRRLKAQNEELATRLQNREEVLSRVEEELACYRSCNGKNPYVDIDEEQRLRDQLKETERQRVQLVHKLASLSSNILKVAGVAETSPRKNPSLAEGALSQLGAHVSALESELQDLKLESRMDTERMRLNELRQKQSSPLCSRKGEGFLR